MARQQTPLQVESLAQLFEGSNISGRAFQIAARASSRENSETVILHALATYKVGGGNTQESYGYAWATAADGTTPKRVGRLSIQIEVAGELSPSSPLRGENADRLGTATRGAYDDLPQRVTVYASSENPDIQVSDTSDD